MVHTGEHGEYGWLVSRAQISTLIGLVIRFHHGLRLCITSFDSGPLRLNEDELATGWIVEGDVAISPPVHESLEIPGDQYDEWYLVSDTSTVQGAEVFVNYGGFSLAAPAADETGVPRPEGGEPDCLTPIRERFWSQLERLRPESYVATGDNDVIVSRNRRFIQAVRAAAERGPADDLAGTGKLPGA